LKISQHGGRLSRRAGTRKHGAGQTKTLLEDGYNLARTSDLHHDRPG
jgi:hypothetical protein